MTQPFSENQQNTQSVRNLTWADLKTFTGPKVEDVINRIDAGFWGSAVTFGFKRSRHQPNIAETLRDGFAVLIRGKPKSNSYILGLRKAKTGVDLFIEFPTARIDITINSVRINTESEEHWNCLGNILFEAYRKQAMFDTYENLETVVVDITKGPVSSESDLPCNLIDGMRLSARSGMLTKACYTSCVRDVINEHKRVASLFAGRYGKEACDAAWKDDEEFVNIDRLFYTVPDERGFPYFPPTTELQTTQLRNRRERARRLTSFLESSWLFKS